MHGSGRQRSRHGIYIEDGIIGHVTYLCPLVFSGQHGQDLAVFFVSICSLDNISNRKDRTQYYLSVEDHDALIKMMSFHGGG